MFPVMLILLASDASRSKVRGACLESKCRRSALRRKDFPAPVSPEQAMEKKGWRPSDRSFRPSRAAGSTSGSRTDSKVSTLGAAMGTSASVCSRAQISLQAKTLPHPGMNCTDICKSSGRYEGEGEGIKKVK